MTCSILELGINLAYYALVFRIIRTLDIDRKYKKKCEVHILLVARIKLHRLSLLLLF